MWTQSTRPAAALQESRAFDAIPLSVQQHPDLTGNPKRLYAALASAQRMNWQPTYDDLAERLSCSTRSIIRWVARLAEVGLIVVRRRGQGLSNKITVIGLAVRSDRVLPPDAPAWQSPARVRSFPPKERDGRTGYIQVATDPSAHVSGRLAGYIRT